MKPAGVINFWTVAGAVAVALTLGIATLLIVMFTKPEGPAGPSRAVITLIPGST